MKYILFTLAVMLVLGTTMYLGQNTKKHSNTTTKSDKVLKDTTSQDNIPTPLTDTGFAMNLSYQGLTRVPDHIFERGDVQTLDLSHNTLTGALPAEIRHMQSLRTLNISHNAMTGLPAELGQLSNLEVLDASYNKLTGLPHELGNLKKLKILDVRGNTYSAYDLHVICEALPNTTCIVDTQ